MYSFLSFTSDMFLGCISTRATRLMLQLRLEQKRAESASAAGSKGKLGTKLAAQKAQTQNQTLNEASRDEVAARDADGAAEARRWQ